MHFKYFSEQNHSVMVNGRAKTSRQTVSIKNGKGYKEVKNNHGTKRIPLKKKDIDRIRKNEFIPRLFNDCKKCLTRKARK